MFSKIALTTTITYLLTQTITYPENAESSTKAALCPIPFLYQLEEVFVDAKSDSFRNDIEVSSRELILRVIADGLE